MVLDAPRRSQWRPQLPERVPSEVVVRSEARVVVVRPVSEVAPSRAVVVARDSPAGSVVVDFDGEAVVVVTAEMGWPSSSSSRPRRHAAMVLDIVRAAASEI